MATEERNSLVKGAMNMAADEGVGENGFDSARAQIDDGQRRTTETVQEGPVTKITAMFTSLVTSMEKNRIASEEKLLTLVERLAKPGRTNDCNPITIVPNLGVTIEDFDGDIREDKGMEWLKRLKHAAVLGTWPEEFMLESARTHLTGTAFKWYNTKRDSIRSWKDFEYEFNKTFRFEYCLTQKWERMRARKQRPGEPISTYFYDKLHLCECLELSFKETKEQIVTGLLSQDVLYGLMAKSHSDPDELLHDVVDFSRVVRNRISPSGFKRHAEKSDKTLVAPNILQIFE